MAKPEKYRCMACPPELGLFVSWAACERHADSTPGHYRFAFTNIGYWPTQKARVELRGQ